MSEALIVQNSLLEGPGTLEKLLELDGFKTKIIDATSEKIPENAYSLLVILGAPESANDNLSYLRSEVDLIRNYVQKNIPILGICLGSQLIAKAFGGSVFKGQKTEIGFYNDLKSSSSFFKGFENPFTVFHWHGDTFELPKEAKRLAYSSDYENQSFQYGSSVGLQFHLEVDQNMINLWLDKAQEKLEKIPYVDPTKIRQDITNNISIVNENMKKFYKNFKLEFRL